MSLPLREELFPPTPTSEHRQEAIELTRAALELLEEGRDASVQLARLEALVGADVSAFAVRTYPSWGTVEQFVDKLFVPVVPPEELVISRDEAIEMLRLIMAAKVPGHVREYFEDILTMRHGLNLSRLWSPPSDDDDDEDATAEQLYEKAKERYRVICL